MRKTLTIAALAVLAATAACKKSEPAPEATADATVAATEAVASATTPPGTYVVFDKDGKSSGTTQINADGSYRDTPPKGLPKAGLVTYKDGKICFDPSGDKEPVECWTESNRAADGSFTATSDTGEVVNVKPKAP